MKIKLSILPFVLLLALVLGACSKTIDAPAADATPQAKQIVLSESLYALMPDNLENVYRMDVVTYSDGSFGATRSIVPFDGNQEYYNNYFIGNTGFVDTSTDLQFQFSGETHFIPFDPQENSTKIFDVIGGFLGLDCICNGLLGVCDETTYLPGTGVTGTGCDSYYCTGSCGSGFGGLGIGLNDGALGVFVGGALLGLW